MKRLATHAHAFIYRLTRGRVGARMGGQDVLLLVTTGRRSGQERTTPVQFILVDGAYVVVAANGGAPRPPAWYLNLHERPRSRVQTRDRLADVEAHEASGEERAGLWAQLTAVCLAGDREPLDGVRRAPRRTGAATVGVRS